VCCGTDDYEPPIAGAKENKFKKFFKKYFMQGALRTAEFIHKIFYTYELACTT
jgi:hypothetical protein